MASLRVAVALGAVLVVALVQMAFAQTPSPELQPDHTQFLCISLNNSTLFSLLIPLGEPMIHLILGIDFPSFRSLAPAPRPLSRFTCPSHRQL